MLMISADIVNPEEKLGTSPQTSQSKTAEGMTVEGLSQEQPAG